MSINNEDFMLVNQSGVDYKTTAADLKTYLTTPPPMPWDEHVANGGVVFHVKDATDIVNIDSNSHFYNIDGTYKGNLSSFGPGEEVVICCDSNLYAFFIGNHTSTWNFGELTDVSNGVAFDRLFQDCYAFNNTGLNEWDTSNADTMNFMFASCSNFNQDLSQWCVTSVTSHPQFDAGCDNWERKNKPVWGTCPRGEDQ